MAIQSYAELKSSIADWLLRDDLTDVIPDFIHNAESELQRDHRVRDFLTTTFSVDSEEETLPSNFLKLESLSHDGPTYFGPVETTDLSGLTRINEEESGAAGAPSHCAILGRSTIKFAPPPDETYDLVMGYWQTISHLSDSVQSNWLLDDAPDIYLYASLVESAPYLKEDERVAIWEHELEKRLEKLDMDTDKTRFSGTITMRPFNPIP